jgi:hypothetical protein
VGLFFAASALLVVGVASAVGRWWAGHFGDRRSLGLLLPPGLLATTLGMVALPLGARSRSAERRSSGSVSGYSRTLPWSLIMERISKAEYGLGSRGPTRAMKGSENVSVGR